MPASTGYFLSFGFSDIGAGAVIYAAVSRARHNRSRGDLPLPVLPTATDGTN
jgi:hypothetical protein